MEKKHIVVLGAGFGGLRAARQIGKGLKRRNLDSKFEVILIDRNEYQTYTPLLYEVATTSKETANSAKLHELTTFRVRSLIDGLPVKFIQNEISEVDTVSDEVLFKTGERIKFDYIVLALGSETNYFGSEPIQKYGFPLKSFWDAINIREKILKIIHDKEFVRVVVGGGGATGVEFAGELKMWCGGLKTDFPSCKFDIAIVEGAPSILAPFEPRIQIAARKRLHELGIRIFENERITDADASELHLKSGKRLPYDLFVWTGGVKPSSVVSRIPLKKDERGRMMAENSMDCMYENATLKTSPQTYALGDNVCFMDKKTGNPVPGTAQAAIAQATIVSENILRKILKDKKKIKNMSYKEYLPKDYPYIIPIGGKFALAKIGPFLLKGFWAWILKGLVELKYLTSIMPFNRALSIWLRGLWVFIQNERLG